MENCLAVSGYLGDRLTAKALIFVAAFPGACVRERVCVYVVFSSLCDVLSAVVRMLWCSD